MTKQLLQQALAALHAMQSYADADRKGLSICDDAIEALQAAIAAPEPEPIGYMFQYGDIDRQVFVSKEQVDGGWLQNTKDKLQWKMLNSVYPEPPDTEALRKELERVKEEPKLSGWQIWMRKSAMESAYFEQTAAARQHVLDVADGHEVKACGETIGTQDGIELVATAQPSQARELSDREVMRCIAESGCYGTVKMSYESGLYSIDTPSLNATKFARAIIAAINAKGAA